MTQKTGREEVIRRLKLHAKPIGELDPARLVESVSGETDRGAVIIIATSIEDELAEQIRTKMVWLGSDERSRLFGPDGPLGTFSSVIRMAYALGIIDRDLAKACDLIREMRNACAHSRKPISFSDDVLCDTLMAMVPYLKNMSHRPDLSERANGKYWLGICSGYVWQAIKHGPEHAAGIINAAIDDGIAAAKARELLSSPDKQP